MLFFFLNLCGTPSSSLFPYTTLFRSKRTPVFGRVDRAKRGNSGQGRHQAGRIAASSRATSVTRRSRSPDETRSEEHTSELQSRLHLVCRLLLEKKKKKTAIFN